MGSSVNKFKSLPVAAFKCNWPLHEMSLLSLKCYQMLKLRSGISKNCKWVNSRRGCIVERIVFPETTAKAIHKAEN